MKIYVVLSNYDGDQTMFDISNVPFIYSTATKTYIYDINQEWLSLEIFKDKHSDMFDYFYNKVGIKQPEIPVELEI